MFLHQYWKPIELFVSRAVQGGPGPVICPGALAIKRVAVRSGFVTVYESVRVAGAKAKPVV